MDYKNPRQNAREAAKERRKRAAANALAELSRLRSEFEQKFTPSAKAPGFSEAALESLHTASAKSLDTPTSRFTTEAAKSIDTLTTPSSNSQLHTFSAACHGDKVLHQETGVDNNPSQAIHGVPVVVGLHSAEPSEAAPLATVLSPKKLSPNNYAKRGARYDVKFLSTKDETIKCDAPSYTSKQMFLEWDGIDRETLKIVNGEKECLFVEFDTIQRVSYNPTGQHLQLIFTPASQVGLQTAVIAMNALPPNEWVELQQLFRQVEKKWHIRCDQEDMSFFDDSIKSMRKKPFEKMETPHVNRSDIIRQKAAEKLPKAPRQISLSTASWRQSLGPNLGIISNVAKTPKNNVEWPKAHLSVEVKNIMAAKLHDQPPQIPRLRTPSKSPSVTSSLISRTSQSPLKEGTESRRSYYDRGPPTKRSTGSQRRNQAPQSSATPVRAASPSDVSSLFGSDDGDHDFSNFGQPDRTPSQRFTDQMNEARMLSGIQPTESRKINPGLFNQPPVSTMRDQSSQQPEKPEHGFEKFMDNIQGFNEIANVVVSSSFNKEQKTNRSPSPTKLTQSLKLLPVKLVTKRRQDADSVTGSDRSSKKLKESYVMSEMQAHDLSPKKPKKPHAMPDKQAQFYYQCKSGQDFLLPVNVNDEVIRLRTKKEMEESGKQSKYDIFDGPWVVLDISETSFPLSSSFFVLGEEDSESVVSRQAKWDKMLTTKIRLNFPENSQADPWVEISRLLPVIDPSFIVTGTPIPSSLEVSTHTGYLQLLERLSVQRLASDSRRLSVHTLVSEPHTLGVQTLTPDSQRLGVPPLVLDPHNSYVKKRSSEAAYDELYVVEIRKGKFAVFVDIDHKSVNSHLYEVAKIRQKRLRLYTKAEAKQKEVTQYDNDNWVKRLLTQHGDIARIKIIVDEYLCSWAGWATEDQGWVPRNYFATDALLRLFDEHNDPFRDIPAQTAVDVDDLVYEDDLKKVRAVAGKDKRSSSGSSYQSSGGTAQKLNKKRGTARRK